MADEDGSHVLGVEVGDEDVHCPCRAKFLHTLHHECCEGVGEHGVVGGVVVDVTVIKVSSNRERRGEGRMHYTLSGCHLHQSTRNGGFDQCLTCRQQGRWCSWQSDPSQRARGLVTACTSCQSWLRIGFLLHASET